MGRMATDGISELLAIEESLSRLKARLSQEPEQAQPMMKTPIPEDALGMARFVYVLRRIRDCRFASTYFGEPAWDILLNLYIARIEGKEATISSASIAACVPSTTALRWINALTDDALVTRTQDPHDARRVILALTDEGYARMSDVMAAMQANAGDAPRLATALSGKDRDQHAIGIPPSRIDH